tara:strand:+ start:7649 stop:8155 length:507 start_codon:yes stop_codon:yes gene_type:complete
MVMQTDGRHHQQPGLTAAHHRPGSGQRRDGLAQAHLIGENSAAARQQPADTCPLVSQKLAAISQWLIQASCSDQLTMGRQRWQGDAHCIEPLLQRGIDAEALTKLLLKATSGFQGKHPTAKALLPATARTDATQSSCRDRIGGAPEENFTGGSEGKTETHRPLGQISI